MKKNKYKQTQACGYYDADKKKAIKVCKYNCNNCSELFHIIPYEDFLIYYDEQGKLIK